LCIAKNAGQQEDSMTIRLELAPELEARLRLKAEIEGQDITAYLQSIAEREAGNEGENEEQRRKNQAAIDLLNAWDAEDATDNPEEIAQRQAEWEEFKTGMNAAHSSSKRVIYP